MYKIVCDYCGEEIIFEEVFQKPKTCPNCNSFLDQLEPQKMSEPVAGTAENQIDKIGQQPCTGLTLIYQKTGKKIHIDQKKVILGREGFGIDVLGEIGQISRIHCVIERINNQYRITDLDSTHGTFMGILKINCKENPQQVLNNDDLVFLGREPFLAQLHFEAQLTVETGDILAQQDNEIISEPNQSAKRKSVVYRCKNCGKDYDHKKDICEEVCQECGTFNEWEEIEV